MRFRMLGVAIIFVMLTIQSVAEPPASQEMPLEEVVVIGKRPGPPLWKVVDNKTDNTLWVFGVPTYLPASLEWDSEPVDYILSQSDEYIGVPEVEVSVGLNPIKAFRIVRTARSLQKNPEGRSLESVLEPDLFVRFEHAVAVYAPGDRRIHKLRPAIAAKRLFNSAIGSVGLGNNTRLSEKLIRIARKHRVRITTTSITTYPDKSRLQDFYGSLSQNIEIACLEATLDTITSDLQGIVARTVAWADGDAREMRQFEYPDREGTCQTLYDEDEYTAHLTSQTKANWTEAAIKALANSPQSFTALPMREIVHAEGLLAKLAMKKDYVLTGQ